MVSLRGLFLIETIFENKSLYKRKDIMSETAYLSRNVGTPPTKTSIRSTKVTKTANNDNVVSKIFNRDNAAYIAVAALILFLIFSTWTTRSSISALDKKVNSLETRQVIVVPARAGNPSDCGSDGKPCPDFTRRDDTLASPTLPL